MVISVRIVLFVVDNIAIYIFVIVSIFGLFLICWKAIFTPKLCINGTLWINFTQKFVLSFDIRVGRLFTFSSIADLLASIVFKVGHLYGRVAIQNVYTIVIFLWIHDRRSERYSPSEVSIEICIIEVDKSFG